MVMVKMTELPDLIPQQRVNEFAARIPGLGWNLSGLQKNLFENFQCDVVPQQDVQNITKGKSPQIIGTAAYWKGKDDYLRDISVVKYNKHSNVTQTFRALMHDLEIMRKLKHTNIHELEGIHHLTDITDAHYIFEPIGIFLNQLLNVRQNRIAFSQIPYVKCFFQMVFNAVDYLHQKSIVHRDLQPQNIFITEKGVVKICNFQNAMILGQESFPVNTTEFRYQPLEEIVDAEKCCNEKVDIWAVCCLFAQFLLRAPLFDRNDREKVTEDIFRLLGFPTKNTFKEFFEEPEFEGIKLLSRGYGQYEYDCLQLHFDNHAEVYLVEFSPFCMEILMMGLHLNPSYRCTANELANHAFFTETPEACPTEDLIVLLRDHTDLNI